ncbi:hypothetical protein BVRB_6g152600 [Beta vulgaris subsp. vulgaris]|nr:hypothetical protein BVRB_6g152600 [Beta vulgaris subsp. vulgaris]
MCRCLQALTIYICHFVKFFLVINQLDNFFTIRIYNRPM